MRTIALACVWLALSTSAVAGAVDDELLEFWIRAVETHR